MAQGLRRKSSVPSGDEISEAAIGGTPTIGGSGVTQVTPGSRPDGENSQFSDTASVDALRAGPRRKNNVGQTTQARQVTLVDQLTRGLRSPTPDRYSHG